MYIVKLVNPVSSQVPNRSPSNDVCSWKIYTMSQINAKLLKTSGMDTADTVYKLANIALLDAKNHK